MGKRFSFENIVPYLFIAPFILSFMFFFLIPAAHSLLLSFFSYKGYGAMRFLGLGNYKTLLTYRAFWVSVGNTLFYFLVHTIPTMILSFTLAYMLQSKSMLGVQKIFKPVLFLPQVVPIVASALIWRIILSRDTGFINQVMGTSIDFLSDTSIRKWMATIVMVWRATGWYMVIFLAGLTTVGDEIYDAAKIDGTNALQRITRVVLPIMRPIVLFAFIMNAIGAFKLYTEPNVLFNVVFIETDVMTIMNILLMNIRGGSFGMAAAVGWIVFIMISLVSIVWFKILGNRKE